MRGAVFKVPKNHDMIGRNIALQKVSAIPDADVPEGRFAQFMSISHLVENAFSFFKLFSM
jgi:hypothetical protein